MTEKGKYNRVAGQTVSLYKKKKKKRKRKRKRDNDREEFDGKKEFYLRGYV